MKTIACRGSANRTLLFALIAALAAGLGLWAGQRMASRDHAAAPSAVPILRTVRLFPKAKTLPAFALTQAGGVRLDAGALKGHWTLVFLGFTHCADVCPTTLTELSQAQKLWAAQPAATRPRLLFVSVDPDRDTPEKLAEYARYFHPDTLTATAPEPALHDFAQAIGMVYMKVPLANGDYDMDHSSSLVLLDPQAREAGLVRPPFKPAEIAADLLQLSGTTP